MRLVNFLVISVIQLLYPSIANADLQQDLRFFYKVSPSMSGERVITTMGDKPILVHESEGVVEWHYCSTTLDKSSAPHEYRVVFFYKSVVAEKQAYVVDRSNGLAPRSCENYLREGTFKPLSVSMMQALPETSYTPELGTTQYWDKEVYYIDLLEITTFTKKFSDICETGGIHRLELKGQISPDSTFAIGKILDKLKPCIAPDGKELVAITVSLSSAGGLLNDGYELGRILRERGITTVIDSGNVCASSCAVAFLGGAKRVVEDEAVIMYHAPYFTGENAYGQRDVDCEVGEDALGELKAYYRDMTGTEIGDRLFERTMWYCSAEDGWVIKGGPAAELYGIATEK